MIKRTLSFSALFWGGLEVTLNAICLNAAGTELAVAMGGKIVTYKPVFFSMSQNNHVQLCTHNRISPPCQTVHSAVSIVVQRLEYTCAEVFFFTDALARTQVITPFCRPMEIAAFVFDRPQRMEYLWDRKVLLTYTRGFL